MLTMTSVFEPRRRIELAPYHTALGITVLVLGLLAAIVMPRVCGPWCHRQTSDEELARLQVDQLAAHTDAARCVGPHTTERDLLRDPWNRQLRVYCAPGHYLWIVSNGADGVPWSSDDVVSRQQFGQCR